MIGHRRSARITAGLGVCSVALAACGGAATDSGGGGGQRPKVTIMVGGLDKIIYMVPTLTQQLGYFSDAGVDVNLIGETSGVGAEDAAVSGQADGGVGFYDHTIDLQAKGKLLESVVQLDQVPGEVELVSTAAAGKVKSPADFAKCPLGITGAGSGTDLLTHYLGIHAGVAYDQIHTVAAGAGDTFINAMDKGTICAGMTTEPTISRMVTTGHAKVLVDMRTKSGTTGALGGTYPAACLFMKTDYVNQHKDTVQRVANAMVKALKWIHSHSATEIADKMPSDYYVNNKPLYVTAMQGSLDMFTPDGHMPGDGPKTVFDVQNTTNPAVQGKEIQLNETFTSEFVDKANA
jgi:NitT/TauT family transport system substrate-binding protein